MAAGAITVKFLLSQVGFVEVQLAGSLHFSASAKHRTSSKATFLISFCFLLRKGGCTSDLFNNTLRILFTYLYHFICLAAHILLHSVETLQYRLVSSSICPSLTLRCRAMGGSWKHRSPLTFPWISAIERYIQVIKNNR